MKVAGFDTAGSIILLHMNKPGSDIVAGVKEGVELLRKQGYEFVKLSDQDLVY